MGIARTLSRIPTFLEDDFLFVCFLFIYKVFFSLFTDTQFFSVAFHRLVFCFVIFLEVS